MEESKTFVSGITTADPSRYFNFPGCRNCLTHPCKKLCFGVIRPGKFMLVHSRDIGKPDCPFVSMLHAEVEHILQDSSLQEISYHLDGITANLTPSEQLSYDIRHYVFDYNDQAGRVRYLWSLIDSGIIKFVRIPLNYMLDPKLRKWFSNQQMDIIEMAEAEEDDSGAPAVTDRVLDEAAAVSLSNPRWEHRDEQKKQSTPETVVEDDEILLKCDTRGLPENATVSFDIFDISDGSRLRIDTVSGKTENDTVSANWKIQDPNDKGEELKLEFEATARGKKSGPCEIAVKSSEFVISV
ncbi:MAG: hypothetical protein GF401_01910 [Chitinivibrionales bacterium]|nr:hypothetical protein [Chitinivibrionales bacterium]